MKYIQVLLLCLVFYPYFVVIHTLSFLMIFPLVITDPKKAWEAVKEDYLMPFQILEEE